MYAARHDHARLAGDVVVQRPMSSRLGLRPEINLTHCAWWLSRPWHAVCAAARTRRRRGRSGRGSANDVLNFLTQSLIENGLLRDPSAPARHAAEPRSHCAYWLPIAGARSRLACRGPRVTLIGLLVRIAVAFPFGAFSTVYDSVIYAIGCRAKGDAAMPGCDIQCQDQTLMPSAELFPTYLINVDGAVRESIQMNGGTCNPISVLEMARHRMPRAATRSVTVGGVLNGLPREIAAPPRHRHTRSAGRRPLSVTQQGRIDRVAPQQGHGDHRKKRRLFRGRRNRGARSLRLTGSHCPAIAVSSARRAGVHRRASGGAPNDAATRSAAPPVERRALPRLAADASGSAPPSLPARISWPCDGAGGARDALVHQRAAEIVGAGVEAGRDALRAHLDPRGLDVADAADAARGARPRASAPPRARSARGARCPCR